jgi:hypothetical protein
MTWIVLDQPAKMAFLTRAHSDTDAALFKPATTEVKKMALPFYTNLHLFRVTNFASMPLLTLDYLADGGRLFYLDGTDTPLTQAAPGDLRITAGNIIAYLNFYFFSVVRPEGEVFLVDDPLSYPYQDTTARAFALQFDFRSEGPAYTITPQGAGWRVETPLFMDGTLTQSTLMIDPLGRVTITGRAMWAGGGGATLSMDHI